jgi:endonuclease YncB( thermonuclease family)
MGVARNHLYFATLAHPRHGGVFAAAAVIFTLGFAAGTTLRPSLVPQRTTSIDAAHAAPRDAGVTRSTQQSSPRFNGQIAYPAEVLRVIDGDTFEARVRVWPGLDVNTKVRLRNIDAPELHARCADEHVKAEAARAMLENILAAGSITVSRVGLDKYGGRVDALVAPRDTADVSAALLNGGWARSYDGGRRGSWC